MSDADHIARARAVRIEDELDRRNAHLKRIGRELVGPCPRCGGTDRFGVNTAKQIWNCRGCDRGGDVIALLELIDGCTFIEAVATLAGEVPRPRRQASARPPVWKERDDEEAGVRAALAFFDDAQNMRATLGELYLQRDRRLDTSEDFPHCLRWHAGVRALIGLFRDIKTDEPRAITRIFLDHDGHKIARKFLGPVAGCAVKIDADEDVTRGLHVGEGLETCLAARQLGFRPAWALGSAAGITRLPVLAGIDALTVFAEVDDGGVNARAIAEVGARWQAAGRELIVVTPLLGDDLNSALIKRPA